MYDSSKHFLYGLTKLLVVLLLLQRRRKLPKPGLKGSTELHRVVIWYSTVGGVGAKLQSLGGNFSLQIFHLSANPKVS